MKHYQTDIAANDMIKCKNLKVEIQMYINTKKIGCITPSDQDGIICIIIQPNMIDESWLKEQGFVLYNNHYESNYWDMNELITFLNNNQHIRLMIREKDKKLQFSSNNTICH